MENAAEALKIAGFTLLFVTALSVAMMTVMQAKDTSETIISYSDKTKYYSNIETDANNSENGNRLVSVYDIIPTLYRYKQEEYIILFQGIGNFYIKQQSSNLGKFKKEIRYLNYNLEDKLQANWRADEKVHVDEIVKILLRDYKTDTFLETLSTTEDMYYNNVGEIVENTQQSNEESQEKTNYRVITYTKK